jgi:cyclopropane fatty-acyl-phospholipid synthase-like methyltransferase
MEGLEAAAVGLDGAAVTDGRKVDRDYYDSSGYFQEGTAHLTDSGSPFQRYRIAKVTEIYDPGPSERVVDLGCGWGTFGFALAPRVAEVVGVDFSRRSIEICEQRLRQQPIPNLRFLCADARATGLEGEGWDLVIAADLFEHLYPDDSAAVVREAHRLLRPGGRFSIWTPHRGHVLEILKNRNLILKADPTHVDYKSMARLRTMLADAGFAIERSYYAESHLPVLRAVEATLLRWVPPLRRRIAVLAKK